MLMFFIQLIGFWLIGIVLSVICFMNFYFMLTKFLQIDEQEDEQIDEQEDEQEEEQVDDLYSEESSKSSFRDFFDMSLDVCGVFISGYACVACCGYIINFIAITVDIICMFIL